MAEEERNQERKTPLFRREYRPKRLGFRVVLLVIAVAIIVFLPKILAVLE